MAQRITAKTFGTGAQGFTVAHRTVEGKMSWYAKMTFLVKLTG